MGGRCAPISAPGHWTRGPPRGGREPHGEAEPRASKRLTEEDRLAEQRLALGLAAVSTQDRHTRASVLRHHAYRPPRSSNFRGMKPTWAQAASTPTSRIGVL